MPSSGCTLTRPRAGAQTGRNKNNPRLPEIGGYIFAVNLYKLYMKGRSKNSKGAHPKSRKFKGEKRRNESIKARSTPFRSPPIIPQCFSKNHSKTRESKIFSYRFLRFLSKMANKKDPKHPEVLGSYNYFSVFVLFEFLLCPTSLLSKGTRIFPKRQKRYQKWSRVARSTPFRSLSGPFLKNPNSSRPAQQENSAILLRISQMSRARGGLEKNP